MFVTLNNGDTMEPDSIDLTEIYKKELEDLFSDDDEMIRIITEDEEIVCDEIVWDQQNKRLKNENILLTDYEKEILIFFHKGVLISEIMKIERENGRDLRSDFNALCKKLCVKNQKEACRRAADLALF